MADICLWDDSSPVEIEEFLIDRYFFFHSTKLSQ